MGSDEVYSNPNVKFIPRMTPEQRVEARRKFLRYLTTAHPLTLARDARDFLVVWIPRMHIVNVLNQAVCLFVTLLIVLSLWSSVTGKRSHLVTQTHRIVNTAKTKAEWHAAALASDFKTLPIQNFEGDDRDEYGHLTFAAYCDAPETRGKDPEWPLRSPHDTSDGLDGLGFESPAELCASMTSLPDRLKIYTFPLSAAESRRYTLAKLAPTFNRGYDVEGHIVENMQREPFATLDAEEAIAFLIPARPYLERVAGYPDDGRETMTANVARMVERIKVEYPGAWKKSEPGCARVMVSAHDTGTYAANRTDPDVLEKAVFIASNADSTTSEDLRDIEEGGPGWRTLSSRFKTSKDVSAVCSLSYHLPRDAVAMRAMVPMTVGTPPPGTKIWATEDHRQVELSFRGNDRGMARERIFKYLRGLNLPGWDIDSDGQVNPQAYMDLMAKSRFCLHVRGTRVQSPRLIEVMMFGCVPVIVADGYELPLSWLLDWSKFSIRVKETEYDKIPELIAAADWVSMHDTLRRVIGFFVYHKEPLFGDAFWTTMLATERQIRRSRECGGPRAGAGHKMVTDVTNKIGSAWSWLTGTSRAKREQPWEQDWKAGR